MKTLRAPSYLASQITYLKEFMDEKNNTLKDMKTSLSNSKVAKVTYNSYVAEVEGSLKEENNVGHGTPHTRGGG